MFFFLPFGILVSLVGAAEQDDMRAMKEAGIKAKQVNYDPWPIDYVFRFLS